MMMMMMMIRLDYMVL